MVMYLYARITEFAVMYLYQARRVSGHVFVY